MDHPLDPLWFEMRSLSSEPISPHCRRWHLLLAQIPTTYNNIDVSENKQQRIRSKPCAWQNVWLSNLTTSTKMLCKNPNENSDQVRIFLVQCFKYCRSSGFHNLSYHGKDKDDYALNFGNRERVHHHWTDDSLAKLPCLLVLGGFLGQYKPSTLRLGLPAKIFIDFWTSSLKLLRDNYSTLTRKN